MGISFPFQVLHQLSKILEGNKEWDFLFPSKYYTDYQQYLPGDKEWDFLFPYK